MKKGRATVTAAPPPLDVLCVGEAMWDLYAPAGVTFDHAESLALRPGGAAVNVALTLAEQGLRVGVAAAVSADPLGQALRARLAAAGVVTAHLTTMPARTALVLIERIAGARRLVSYRSGEEPEPVVQAAFAARILFLTGLLPSEAQQTVWRAAARDARLRKIPVVIDVNARPRMWTDVDSGAVEARCRPARVVDPTGCGDAFSAALLAALAAAESGEVKKASFWTAALRRGHALARTRLGGQRP